MMHVFVVTSTFQISKGSIADFKIFEIFQRLFDAVFMKLEGNFLNFEIF